MLQLFNHSLRSFVDDVRFNISTFQQSRNGFTLIEVVIVLGIFLMASTALMGIFLSANKASQRTVALARTGSDARWVMEQMVEEIRLASIRYGGSAIATPSQELHLTTPTGETLDYWLRDSEVICGARDIACVAFSRDGGATLTSMTPPSTNVRQLDFYVTPTSDPFIDGATEVGQPQVTILFATETVGARKEEQARLSLQTTVSTRVYKR